MYYKDIIMTLKKEKRKTIAKLATAVGLNSQQALSQRLKDSWNPGMKDAQLLLSELGYKIVFMPKDTDIDANWYEPEFPQKLEGGFKKSKK